MDKALLAVVWFALLLVLMLWSIRHQFKARGLHAPTTYLPHISHVVLYLYLACMWGAFAVGLAFLQGEWAGLIFLLLFAKEFWTFCRVLAGLVKNQNVVVKW